MNSEISATESQNVAPEIAGKIVLERTGSKRTWLVWLLRLAIATLLLSLLFVKVDVKDVLAELRNVDTGLWCVAILLSFAFRGILTYQTSVGLSPLGMHATFGQLLKITLIADFYALILPGTLLAGGAASWYKLKRIENKGIASAALVVFFRITYTLTLLGVGLVAICLDARSWMRALRLPALGMFLACLVLFLPFISRPAARFVARTTEPVLRSRRLPEWLQSKVREGRDTVFRFQTLRASQILLVFALSMLAIALAIFVWHLLAKAVGIQLPLLVIAWISSFLWIVEVIPISIGGLGLREMSLVAILHDYGIAQAQAVSYSLAIFSLMVVSGLAGGFLEAWEALFDTRVPRGALADRTMKRQTNETRRAFNENGSPKDSAPPLEPACIRNHSDLEPTHLDDPR